MQIENHNHPPFLVIYWCVNDSHAGTLLTLNIGIGNWLYTVVLMQYISDDICMLAMKLFGIMLEILMQNSECMATLLEVETVSINL